MTLYFPQLNKVCNKLYELLQQRPSLQSWAVRLAEKYQDQMGHRRLGTSNPKLIPLGLFSDDILSEEMSQVQEALKRITDKQQFDRTFRIRRAMQLQMHHDELPREEWVTRETDESYLWPHLQAICREREERKKYDSTAVKNKPLKGFY